MFELPIRMTLFWRVFSVNRSIVQALGAVLLWSMLAYLSLQLIAVPPFLLLGCTLTVGALCSVKRYREWRVPWYTLLLGVYGLFGSHFSFFLALRYAPPVEASLINYLWPLLIVLMAPLFLGMRLRPHHLIAAALGFSGAFLVVLGDSWQFKAQYWMGYLLAFMAAVCWASYSLLTKRVPPFPNAAIGLFCLVSGILALLIHIFFEPHYTFVLAQLPYLILLGFGSMGAAFFLWDAAIKNGDPRTIGSLAYLTPLLSATILMVSGKGQFTYMTLVAMVMIISGAVIGAHRPKVTI